MGSFEIYATPGGGDMVSFVTSCYEEVGGQGSFSK